MFRTTLYTLLCVLVASAFVQAETVDTGTTYSSGDQRVALIELFTSEGCSSCPPADRWLSGLKTDPGLWKDFVPVAFHVDYWDYIGWTDQFAKAEFSDRQRQHAREGGARAVYTPGVFRQGKDWRGWRREEAPSFDASNIGERAIGELSVRVHDAGATIRFDTLDPSLDRLNVTIAILGMNLETRVRAGENKGRKLNHDFVALDVVAVPLEKSTTGYSAVARLPGMQAKEGDLAIAAWVSEAGSQAAIQAVGGYLPAEST